MKQAPTAKPRSIVDGNIVMVGNKNFTMTVEDDGKIWLTPIRNPNEKYTLSSVEGDDTGMYEIVHPESQCALRNFNAQKVRVVLLGNLFMEVTNTVTQNKTVEL